MNNLLFYLSLGGATLIMIYGGIQLIRKYPRIKQPSEPRGFTESEWIENTKRNEAWCKRKLDHERSLRQ